ncbi:hypothetical protein AKJ54_01145 [candidate division MSBL1 archaeon SCGC-AAA382K21]|uniref:HTH bat-type domain-containing protein n=1 Tax=candidate division MSBL1 archaeon SCGC-AAA382K21 TaxID=1698283 RepID=A0A133VJV3_9EURY|nr:hypothetical protein AKJ54_01145 [candidate division MSBL1 archaeon SCGC-AAA382K21]
MLRKATLEVIFGENLLENLPFEMNLIEEGECFRIIRFGGKRVAGLVRVEMKSERHPSEISKNENFLEFEVLNREGNKYFCVVRKSFSEIFKELIGDPDFFSKQVGDDLFLDLPVKFNGGGAQVSLVGTKESINGYLELLENLDIQYKLKSVKDYDEFEGVRDADLTNRQREIISTAFDLGYYDTPREISSEKLAKIFEISQPTLLEHLKKSEEKIMKHFFE